MTFEVRFLPGAEDDLAKIRRDVAERIIKKTDEILSENPLPHGRTVRRITGVRPPLSRLRIGDWRVFFEIEKKKVWVLAVARKPKAERMIKKLR